MHVGRAELLPLFVGRSQIDELAIPFNRSHFAEQPRSFEPQYEKRGIFEYEVRIDPPVHSELTTSYYNYHPMGNAGTLATCGTLYEPGVVESTTTQVYSAPQFGLIPLVGFAYVLAMLAKAV